MESRRPFAWFSSFLAAYLLAVSVGLLALDRATLLAAHPAHGLILVGAAAVAAVVLLRSLFWRRVGTVWRRWVVYTGRIVVAPLVLGLGAALIWLRPFPAADPALAALRPVGGITVATTVTEIAFLPATAATVGVIVYPGARVDPRAYAVYARSFAEAGFAAFIVKGPLEIGFLAFGQVDRIIATHPEIRAWVVGGHSLGGVVACQFAAAHPEHVRGLLLYASYPAGDLSSALAGTAVTSIVGTNDGLATPAKVAAARPLLPAATRYVEVVGGIHAYFGDYGAQPGDGQPTIDRDVVRQQITAASLDLLRHIAASPPAR